MAAETDHARAQLLSSEEALLRKNGKQQEAREKFALAAEEELRALEALPESRIRTRGIIAVSAASLLYKARHLQQAARLLNRLLGQGSLLPAHEAQLRELLEVVWDEQSLPEGTSYAPQEIEVSLRGGAVGYGTAPLNLALEKSDELQKLIIRTAEFVSGKEIRTKGPPAADIQNLVQARVTQPVAGSYRFSIKLVEPDQLEIFGERKAVAQQVAPLLFAVMKTATEPGQSSTEKLRQLVPDDAYRTTLVKLLRNVVPRDDSLREVELATITRIEGVYEPVREAVVLHKEVRATLDTVLRADKPKTDEAESATLKGTLRALHLDRHWLQIIDEEQRVIKCFTAPDLLDDIVGPMVNKRVVVHGVWKERKSRRWFHASDVDLEGS